MAEPPFRDLTVDDFLASYWQKRPLLIRSAIADAGNLASRAELVELAAEATVGCRLITAPRGDRGWLARAGPFAADEFAKLSGERWTLLVQEVDRYLPNCRRLLDRFRFTPNWRLDDVMVSYASDGGGIGPHLDRYDVFLIQVAGRRRWRITTAPVADERLTPGIQHPVLEDFAPDAEWIVEEGDLLYLPPRFAHEGVAIGESITCSVGFRTPDPRELVASFIRQLGPARFDAIRYSDPDLTVPERLGELTDDARRRLRDSIRKVFADDDELDRWIGRFVTQPVRGNEPSANGRLGSPAELRDHLDGGGVLRRSARPHFAWCRGRDGDVQLFVGGEVYELGQDWAAAAELLCSRQPIDAASLRPRLDRGRLLGLMVDLVLRGYLVMEGPRS